MEDQIVIAPLKFCTICGHEGHDEMCPICNEKMESLDAEVEKLAEKEGEKDLTDDAGLEDLSLEEVVAEEEKDENI